MQTGASGSAVVGKAAQLGRFALHRHRDTQRVDRVGFVVTDGIAQRGRAFGHQGIERQGGRTFFDQGFTPGQMVHAGRFDADQAIARLQVVGLERVEEALQAKSRSRGVTGGELAPPRVVEVEANAGLRRIQSKDSFMSHGN